MTTMRVTLISPYSEITSIGVRSISAFLKSKGIKTQLIFMPLQDSFFSKEDFLCYSDKAIDNLSALIQPDDIIGISLMSHYFDSIVDLTKKLKTRFPSNPVVWGGVHPTVRPDECVAVADHVCLGDGETAFYNLCIALGEGKFPEDIPGVWSKKNNQIFRCRSFPEILDLDQIPPPDFDLDNDYILKNKNDFVRLTEKNMALYHGSTYWTMYTRGCPFRCAYCGNDALAKAHPDLVKVRSKSPQYICAEINAVTKKLPFIKFVYFVDDTMLALSENEIYKFSECYRQFVGIPFVASGVHPVVFSEKKLQDLINGGLVRIRMGIQTGSEKTLKHIYRRHQDNQTVIHISKILSKYKNLVPPNFDIIVDNPWETVEDRLATIDLLRRLEAPYTLTLLSLTFFPGTQLYQRALDEGVITEKAELRKILDYKHSYINLVMALFGLIKIPSWLLKILLSSPLIRSDREFPFLHKIVFGLAYLRKGVLSFRKRDFSVFPPSWQKFLCPLLCRRRSIKNS